MAQPKKDDLPVKAALAAVIALAVIALIYWLSGGPGPALAPTVPDRAADQTATAQPPAQPVCELGEPDLYEAGLLRNDAFSASEPGEGWVLGYQRLKKPLQLAPLCFAADSRCRFGDEYAACDLNKLGVGDNVRVEGHPNADGTFGVVRLLLIKKAVAPAPAP